MRCVQSLLDRHLDQNQNQFDDKTHWVLFFSIKKGNTVFISRKESASVNTN